MKKKLRLVSLFLALTLCVSLLSGCSSSNNNTTAAADNETTKGSDAGTTAAPGTTEAPEDVVLTVWVPSNARIEDMETNAMTIWMEEQLGCDLEIVSIPSEDYMTKVNMSLTAGDREDLPDVIMFNGGNVSDTYVWSWAQEEAILPLTAYYKDPELSANINDAIERTGMDYIQQIVSPDGEIYGVPMLNQSYGSEFPAKLWIYKPWLDALNEDIPTTTDEFYALLQKVAATDLNGNGKKDEIGMLGATTTYTKYLTALMNAFVYAGDKQYRVVEDGVVSAAYTTDEWKEGLKYLKTLFDEGLIASESLTIAEEQYKTLLNSEDPTVFSFVYYTPDMITSGTDRSKEYICIDTLTGPEGVNYATYEASVATVRMVVTANCDNPEMAFRLGDLMSSEVIGISQRWGEEGVDWDYAENVADIANYKASVDGFDISIVAYNDAAFWGGSEMTNSSWRQIGPLVRHYGIANGLAIATDGGNEYSVLVNEANTLYQTADHEPAEVIPKLIYTTEEAEAIAEIESLLKSYVDECMAYFVKGTKDIDGEWDSYLAELEKIGLSDYLKVVQGAYDRMYK